MSNRHRILGLATVVGLLLIVVSWIGTATAAPRARVENPHGRFRDACANCHGADGWKPARIARTFDFQTRKVL